MLTWSGFVLFMLGGGYITAIIVAWIWIDKTVKVTKEAGTNEEKLRQSQEALDAIDEARKAEIAVERNVLDPKRLREDDGYSRD